MPANHANHWKAVLATSMGAAAVLVPGIAQAQQVAQASGPVTSISQLSDVQPTDWAFQALQSLVERYGCIAGYPDRTYRGNRAMTRFEFAAGMNACLDRINELIAAGLADKVSREDLATLQRLQEEFAAELAALKGRVDVLEEDVADLQSKVFNPVTKLNVQVIAALLGSGLTDDIVDDTTGTVITESDQANFLLPYRIRMNFDASFTGSDRLRIRMEAEDAETAFFSGDPGVWFGGDNDTFELDDFYYQFRPFNGTTVRVGANSTSADALFNYGAPFQSLSDLGDNGPIFTSDGTQGQAAFAFNTSLTEQFTLAYGYGVGDSTDLGNGFGDSGVFGGDHSHAIEVGFLPSDTFGLYFQFASNYFQDFSDGIDGDLFNGPTLGPIDAAAGLSTPVFLRVNAFSVAAEWEITPRVIFSGWFSGANFDYNVPENAGYVDTADAGEEDAITWLAGFLFPDLFIEGAEGGVVFGQSPYSDDADIDGPFFVDVYYTIPINDFLQIVPSAYFISNPNGGERGGVNDPTIGVGAIRAEFNY